MESLFKNRARKRIVDQVRSSFHSAFPNWKIKAQRQNTQPRLRKRECDTDSTSVMNNDECVLGCDLVAVFLNVKELFF